MAEDVPTAQTIGFKRTLLPSGLVFATLELVFVVLPLFPLFQPTDEQRQVVSGAALPVAAGALIVWYAALAAWLLPVQRLLRARRHGLPPAEGVEGAAYRSLERLPLRVLGLRWGWRWPTTTSREPTPRCRSRAAPSPATAWRRGA